MGKTVAITGVNSYFAATILPLLETDPAVDKVIGIDVSPWKGGYAKVEFHRADIRDNTIADILAGADVVYHLAFIVGQIQDTKKALDININGTRNVFEACVKNNVAKVVYTSSSTVYGAHADNPIGFREDATLRVNADSYYNESKVKVETFARDFFRNHPDIVFTVIRSALLFGPRINNMFSKLYDLPVSSLPMGRTTHNQYIHEEDLGSALHLAMTHDLPGIYNVGADDGMATRHAFAMAGVRIIPVPTRLLKLVAAVGFKLRLFPAGRGWVSLGEYTIFMNCDKFKQATGWKPRYTSRQTFESFLAARKRDAKDNPIQATLSWIFKSGPRTRPTMAVLNVFRLGKVPGLRRAIPWMNPKKNSMSYLPVNKSLGQVVDQVLPAQVVHDFINAADTYVVMDKCGCRLAYNCQHHTPDIGCLFMGESALKIPHGVSRRITREQAHAHVDRAISVGLIPMTGKVRVDNFIFLTPDRGKLLSVCFCCHCCCMMTAFKHIPGPYLDGIMPRIEGLEIQVTDACVGCGTCVEFCGFNAITIENGKAVHNDQCRGCGRCETRCPQGAVKITINNPHVIEDVKNRIEQYVDFKGTAA